MDARDELERTRLAMIAFEARISALEDEIWACPGPPAVKPIKGSRAAVWGMIGLLIAAIILLTVLAYL